jgi:hypothetical protein
LSVQARYRAYGLSIDSAWPVPGAMTMSEAEPGYSGQADIEILDGSAIVAQHGERQDHARKALVYECPGVGRYLCERARIVVTPFAGARMSELLEALIASALPATLWMRGEVVLHAAAVQFPGVSRAIAIAGSSGSGKSMILSQLAAAEARVVGDDTLCARLGDHAVQVSGLPGAYFLRHASSSADEKWEMCLVPKVQQLSSAHMGALLVLDLPRPSEGFGFRRLRGTSALEALLRNRHRSRIPRFLQSEGALFPNIVQFLERLAIYSWTRCEGARALNAREIRFLSCLTK